MSLRADVHVARPGFDLRVKFDVAAGSGMAVLGPNGAGKSTLLAALAGTVQLDDGEVVLGERVLERAGHVRLRPEHRRITLLDQKAQLFPHLTLTQNISFGARSRGHGRIGSRRIALEWLDRIGLGDRAEEKPHALSGGQRQRVALARALAAEPRAILLDEPFAALDAQSAPAVRTMLSNELARTGTTSVLVTHDLTDAWRWSKRCLVLADGRVVDEGAPADLAVTPRHRFTAAIAGFCVVDGTWTQGRLAVGDGAVDGTPDDPVHEGDRAVGVVAPRDVGVSAERGQFRAVLSAVSVRAGLVRLEHASGLAADITLDEAIRLNGGQLPAPGDRMWLSPRGLRVLPG